jgi:hypothetical protein
MTHNGYRSTSDGFLTDYLSLDESAGTIIRQLKKTLKPDTRRKLVRELLNLDKKQLEILDKMDRLAKPT